MTLRASANYGEQLYLSSPGGKLLLNKYSQILVRYGLWLTTVFLQMEPASTNGARDYRDNANSALIPDLMDGLPTSTPLMVCPRKFSFHFVWEKVDCQIWLTLDTVQDEGRHSQHDDTS